MIRTNYMLMVVMTLLTLIGVTSAQTQRPGLALAVKGCMLEAPVVQIQGRTLVEVQDFARISDGSLSFERDRIILTTHCDASKAAADDTAKSRFSGAFTRAGIEAVASIREWGGMLMITVQNGYPVGNTMAGNTILAYEGRAADSVALAASAASTTRTAAASSC